MTLHTILATHIIGLLLLSGEFTQHRGSKVYLSVVVCEITGQLAQQTQLSSTMKYKYCYM
jgi:hypothetical protein